MKRVIFGSKCSKIARKWDKKGSNVSNFVKICYNEVQMGIKWIKRDEMGLFWECNSMQFNKMPKLKRLKGFSEYVKRLKHPQKTTRKKSD